MRLENTYQSLLEKMTAVYREQSGVEPSDASDIGIRLQVLAGELAQLYHQMETLNAQLFPHTSSGLHLDMHAQLRGVERKPAICAQGTLTFFREQPALSGIEIPKGTLAATTEDPLQEYETMEKAWISKGNTQVTVPAQAKKIGQKGNMAAGRVTLLMDVLPGVSRVENQVPFGGGVAEEEDEALRSRLIHSYHNISNSTNAAYYHDIALARSDVSKVAVLPRKRGRGTVDVVLSSPTSMEAETASHHLRDQFLREKEINVDVAVYPASPKEIPLILAIQVGSEHEYALLKQQCEQVVDSFFQTLGIGAPFYRMQLGGQLMQLEGMENYSILSPTDDIYPLPEEMVRPLPLTIQRKVSL